MRREFSKFERIVSYIFHIAVLILNKQLGDFCYLFPLISKAIVGPVKSISASTERMMKLDRAAACTIHSKDEIGLRAQNVNDMYFNLLSTIEHLERERDRVSEMERANLIFYFVIGDNVFKW